MASDKNDPFSGLFDLNGDGKTDLAEEFLFYQIFEECEKDDDADEDDDDGFRLPEASFNKKGKRPPPVQSVPRVIPYAEKPIPSELTPKEYKAEKRGFLCSCVLTVVAAFDLSIIPAIVVWAAIDSFVEEDSASGFVAGAFLLIGAVVIGMIIAAAVSQLNQSRKRFKSIKAVFRNTPLPEENGTEKAQEKKTVATTIVCIGLVLALVASFFIVKATRVSSAYRNAERLIEAGDYHDAEDVLLQIEDSGYKDTAALILLCRAHIEWDNGSESDAYYALKDAEFYHQTPAQQSRIENFRSMLDAELDAQIQRSSEQRRQEYESRIVNGVPFVGMAESRIGDTSLGKPSGTIRHNREMINGSVYWANLYDFYQAGRCIFTARCVKGVVTQVWDNRNSASGFTGSSSAERKELSNEPDVGDFSDPEEFYYYYWDDFFDYEDAEDYYYEHGGK